MLGLATPSDSSSSSESNSLELQGYFEPGVGVGASESNDAILNLEDLRFAGKIDLSANASDGVGEPFATAQGFTTTGEVLLSLDAAPPHVEAELTYPVIGGIDHPVRTNEIDASAFSFPFATTPLSAKDDFHATDFPFKAAHQPYDVLDPHPPEMRTERDTLPSEVWFGV
jgi:hypothetical protein